MKASKASAFLQNMTIGQDDGTIPSPAHQRPAPSNGRQHTTRQGLKHIGGYLDRETVEKVAVLRARLGLDNSQLLTLAINELHSKHQAHRAFNDR